MQLRAQSTDTIKLGLGDAARLAADSNAQVIEARYHVDQVRARALRHRSFLLPQLHAQVVQSAHTFNTATFGLEFPTSPGQHPIFDPNGEVIGPVRLSDVRGRLTQTLFDWSALTRARSANAAVAAAVAARDAAAQRAGSIAANAYIQAIRARQLYSSRLSDAKLAWELLAIARQQLEAGTGVRLDVTRAEAQLALIKSQLVSARNAVERTGLTLVRALGLPAGTQLILTDTLPGRGASPGNVEEGTQRALMMRGDLQALQAQIKAAELQLAATRAERLPTLTFSAGDGYIGKRWDRLLHTYDWAFQISVPVFQGLQNRARAQEQEAQLSELQTRRHDLEKQYRYEVRAAILDVTASTEQVDAAAAWLRFAEQELSDSRDRYTAGVASSADVVTASLRLNEARTAYSEAIVAYQTARVALATAEGNVTELP